MKYKIKEEEMFNFLSKWLKTGYEVSATICKKDNTLHFENITIGSKEKVKIPEFSCNEGTPFGYIHTHSEEKGISDVDIFCYLQHSLTDKTKFPRMDCVIYPMYDKDGRLYKIGMECDYVSKIKHDDVKQIPKFGKERDEQNIEFIKHGNPYIIRGLFEKMAFIADMNEIRKSLIDKKLIKNKRQDIAKIIWKNNKPSEIDIDDIELDF